MSTPAERLRELHPMTTGPDGWQSCWYDGQDWPCNIVKALDELQDRATRATEIAEQAAALYWAARRRLDEQLDAIPNPAGERRIREGLERQAARERKLMAADALADAVDEGDPPTFFDTVSALVGSKAYECAYCQGSSSCRETIQHAEGCSWRILIAALRAYREAI